MIGDFRLGPWLVEPQRNLISTKDRKVRLEPKVMDVLAFLVEHAGEVLHKERIIDCVWQGAFVGDDVLTHAISELRKALQDDAQQPRYIETIPKRGYRLVADVFRPEAATRYRIQESIGQGAMGEVHLAEDTLLKRKVALKFALEDKEKEEKWAERLQREALAAAALDHPFICKVYETGRLDGRTFIAMEYVEGPTLADRLSQGPLPLGEALNIALEIAEALEVAHQEGIVHRDLKPSNISLTAQGHVKITDFGVAKRFVASDENAQEQQAGTLTTSMTASGTIPYMSPEQVTGRPVDPRSDIFALGVLLYEMLSAVNPFRRQLPMEMAAAIQEAIPAPLAKQVPGVGQLLEHAVLRMLAKHPDQRYQSVHDVLTDLRRIENTLTGPRTPEGQKTAPRSRALATAVAAAAIVLFMGLWWYSGFHPLRQSGDEQDMQRERTPNWIAVLPFSSASDDPQQQDFIEGLGDELIALQPDYPWAYQHLGLAYLGKLKELRRRGLPESAGEQRLMLEALEKAAELAPSMRGQLARAYYFLGETRKADEICSDLIGLSEYFPPTAIAGCHMFRDDIDRAFQWIEKGLEEKDNFIFWFRYHATDELRQDPRYRVYLRRINQEP